jgi:hypothetical protein
MTKYEIKKQLWRMLHVQQIMLFALFVSERHEKIAACHIYLYMNITQARLYACVKMEWSAVHSFRRAK